MLKGQKLQGVLTSNEVQEVLNRQMLAQDFPLFTTINLIVQGKRKVQDLLDYQRVGQDEGLKLVQQALEERVNHKDKIDELM